MADTVKDARARRFRVRAAWLGALAAIVVVAAVGGGTAAGSDSASPGCTPRAGAIPHRPATFVGETTVAATDGRMRTITLNSPALSGQTHVNVLLPRGYDPSGRTRYPVLYLLHGANGSYDDWHTQGNVEQIVDQVSAAKHLTPFIVVMPDAGLWGWYSDWYGTSSTDTSGSPPPAWTEYHIHELIPWIDRHFPTNASRNGRAVAGLSMGGFGTMSYASRFPDLFSAAGSFSGWVDSDLNYPVHAAELVALRPTDDGGRTDQCWWGDFVTQQVRWQGNDPTYLAESLKGMSLFVASGGGDQNQPTGLIADPVEETVYLMSRAFVGQLDQLHIAHSDDFYGSGFHVWSSWQTDLQNFLPQLAAAWAHPGAVPPATSFSYRSILPRFSVWGWSFTAHHQATEFTYLQNVGRAGLTAIGSGPLDVVTAPLYRPGGAYGVGGRVVRADRTGRLHFTVDLGAAHTSEQKAFDDSTIAGWTHRTMTIKPAA